MKTSPFTAWAILGCALLAAAVARAQVAPAPTSIPGATTPATAAAPPRGAEALLTTGEVATAQGCPITEVNGRVVATEPFRVSQWYYTAAETNKSVVLVTMQTNPADANKRSIRAYWEGAFGRYKQPEDEEKEAQERTRRQTTDQPGTPARKAAQENEEEEEKLKNPPRRVKDLGEEAFWTRSHVNGTLFVLKGETLLRVSVGGSEDDDRQLGKCRALAEKMLARL